jgi:hypothetical protein
MTASELLSQLREKGVEIKASGKDRLVIDAPKGSITTELRKELTAHKAELLQILKSDQQLPAAAVVKEPTKPETRAPQVTEAPVAATKSVEEADSPATLADEEIKQLEAELLRMRAEEQARRAEFESARLAAENALRAELERRSRTEADAARQRAEHEKQRIAAEAREHTEEESRRQIAEHELARAEEELRRMRSMEDARRAEVETRLRAAEEAHRAELETRRLAEDEQARVHAEEERRLLEAEARKRAQEDELRRHAEMRFQAVEIEIARVHAREEARRKAAEDARLLAEQTERRRAEEEARRHAEAEAHRRAEEEARLRTEIEAQMRAEADARRKAEEEIRRKAEEEARRRAEDEAVRMAAAEAQRLADETARRQAEEEQRRQAEEAAHRRAEEEALRRAAAEAIVKAEEDARLRAAEETRQHAEMEARIRAEVAAKLRAEDEARRAPEAEQNQPEPYPFEIERAEVDEPAQPITKEAGGKVKEIVEWFDVGIESTPVASPQFSGEHFSHEGFGGSMQDDSSAEFHAVSVPETDSAPSAISPATLNRLSSAKAAERAGAVAELARVGGEEAFHHINAAFDDQSVEVRSTAARALFNSQDDRAAAFTRALREAAPARRRKIGGAIASSGLAQEAIRNLTGESRDKTYDAFSLLFLMSKAGEVQPLMRAIEDHPNIDVRLAVVKLLALSGQPDILPAFRRMAVRGSLPPEVRSAVMEAIYQITSQSPADASSVV